MAISMRTTTAACDSPGHHGVTYQQYESGLEADMNRIKNLAICFFFSAAMFLFTTSPSLADTDALRIESATADGQKVVIVGTTSIPPETSTYIQYYVGKLYDGTLSTCIYADGFHAGADGGFTLEIPVNVLKGNGRYEIVLEQNPRGNTILPPEHWTAFRKNGGKIAFGDITSMGEISNLALTVGMTIARTEVTVGMEGPDEQKIHITDIRQMDENIIVRGTSDVDPSKSTYIQYYIGKHYPGTLTNCILSDGFHAAGDGSFELKLPVSALRGPGQYEIALEQNPKGNSILPPEHWIAFRKTEGGIVFGDISAMGEIANLALTVGMELTQGRFAVE